MRKGTILGSDDMGPFLSLWPDCDHELIIVCLCSYLKNGAEEAGNMKAS